MVTLTRPNGAFELPDTKTDTATETQIPIVNTETQ